MPPNTPRLLVVYDSRWGSRVEPHDALTAMYGLQAVVINVPPDPAVEPSWGGERFVGKRGVSPGYNRSVSALGPSYLSSRVLLRLLTSSTMTTRE